MKIGIIRTSSIGDVVLATACLDHLQRIAPDASILWLGRQPALKLIQLSWPNVSCVDWPSKVSSSANREIFNQLVRCDVVVDLQTNHRSRNLQRKLRHRGVRVFAADKFNWYRAKLVLLSWLRGRTIRLTDDHIKVHKHQFRMMLDALNDAIGYLGLPEKFALDMARPKLRVDALKHSDASWIREADFGVWLAVAAGASHPTKRAPAEVLIDILTDISAHWPHHLPLPGLLFVGGAEDRAAAVSLMDQTHWTGPVINLAGKLSLDETMLALSKTSVLLSNDSGLAHIAEALGKPVAVLFGPTIESFGFPPQRTDSRGFSSNVGCRPCSKHGKRTCRFQDQLCFRSIDTREVARYLSGILASGGAS